MDIIGIGYIGLESPESDAWRTYGPEVLGMGLATSPKGDENSVYLRMDDRGHRLAVHPGPVAQLSYLGWEARDRSAYRDALERFAAAGVDLETGNAELAEMRGVREVSRFKDPLGYQHEIFYGQKWMPATFRSGRSSHEGFVCDEAGVGHIVLTSPEPIQLIDDFFMKVMGFKWFGYGFGGMNMTFLRPKLNSRSHCIAYAHAPNRFGLHHIALGHKSLDDVGLTQDIVMDRKIQMQMTLGRHTNDPVISFYHLAPSGLSVECFWEEKPWVEDNIGFEANPASISRWGHRLVGPFMGSTVRQLVADAQPS